MKRQCECGNQADEIVFGLRHQCEPPPEPVSPPIPPRSLVPSWRFVIPETEVVAIACDPLEVERQTNPYDMDDDERRGF